MCRIECRSGIWRGCGGLLGFEGERGELRGSLNHEVFLQKVSALYETIRDD